MRTRAVITVLAALAVLSTVLFVGTASGALASPVPGQYRGKASDGAKVIFYLSESDRITDFRIEGEAFPDVQLDGSPAWDKCELDVCSHGIWKTSNGVSGWWEAHGRSGWFLASLWTGGPYPA